jgi:Na+/H+ antiporter NhaD/arsenite permease-like protein
MAPAIISILFILGYIAITFEAEVKVNKAAIALLAGIVCWGVYLATGVLADRTAQLLHYLAEVTQVVFFLVGAMVIVEIIDAHNGFSVFTDRIQVRSKRGLLWLLGSVSFVLSGILDNLTDTIVMVTVLRRLLPPGKERWLFGAMTVVTANAGGVWTPIGDVTTTMLWIGGQITTMGVITELLIPAILTAVVTMAGASFLVKGKIPEPQHVKTRDRHWSTAPILALGIACLVAVPIWKVAVGLPPFMGMLLGMTIIWLVTDMIHRDSEKRGHLKVTEALRRIDMPVALFFLGILLAVMSLDAAGVLHALSGNLRELVPHLPSLAAILGVISAVIDNVPLVAAAAHMYSLTEFPPDHPFWQLITFCVGTGGSLLLIGSAAGVALMGMEKVTFWWYFRHVSWLALIGYIAGVAWYVFFRWVDIPI